MGAFKGAMKTKHKFVLKATANSLNLPLSKVTHVSALSWYCRLRDVTLLTDALLQYCQNKGGIKN